MTKRERAKSIDTYIGADSKRTVSEGVVLQFQVEHDIDFREPWIEHDGHGIISEWRSADRKSPGERILCSDHGRARFYDIEATTQRAKADGWGCGEESHAHKTRGETIACAVLSDYKHMRAWCNDEWTWCGWIVTLDIDGCEEDSESVWGYESTDEEYIQSEMRSAAARLLRHYRKMERQARLVERERIGDAFGVPA